MTICFFGALFGIDCMSLLRQIEAIYSVPLGQRKYAVNNQLASTTDGPFVHFVGRIERPDSNGRLKLFIDAVTRPLRDRIGDPERAGRSAQAPEGGSK